MKQALQANSAKSAARLRSWLIPLAVGLGLLGLTVSFSVFDSVQRNRMARLESEFRLDVNQRLAKLNQGLARSAEKLASVSAFYLSSEEVDAREFRNFTAGYLRREAGLSLLAWAPIKMSDESLDESFNGPIMAGMSLPLLHIEPGPQPQLDFGDDLLAIPGMSAAVEAAFTRGHIEYLLTVDNIIMVTPTLDNVDWSGVAIGILPISALKTWLGLDNWSVALSLVADSGGKPILQSSHAGDPDRAYISTVSFGARTLNATAMPALDKSFAGSAWGTFAAGIIITALLMTLILALAGNAARAERIVRERTRELEQAEAEARGQAIRLANEVARNGQVIASIPSILICVDANGLITQWNRATQQLSGIDSPKVVGRSIEECGWPGELDKLAAGVQQGLSKNIEVRLDNLIFSHARGTEATIGMNVMPIRDSEGRLDGCLIIGADITDKNNMEMQLRESQRLEAVGRLASGIAHEVNTPAQFVSDNTTFLKEAFQDLIELESIYNGVISEVDATLTDEQKKRIADAQQAADRDFLLEEVPQAIAQSMDGIARIADIVRAMKEFSHPGGGGGKELVDFNHLISNAITVAANEWKYHARVETELDETLPSVACFPRELNQVVLNLIINAAHAIADSKGDKADLGTVTIKTSHTDAQVEMRLSDTGTGIPVEVRDKIFEPFFTTKEVGRGSGQGLALAYSAVVEQHGGQLSFETEMGVGTTFVVNLPLQTQEASSEAMV